MKATRDSISIKPRITGRITTTARSHPGEKISATSI